MKKIGIVLATILWIGTAVKYITGSFLKDADVLSAFQTLNYTSAEAKIVAYGKCNMKVSDVEKKNYVKKILSQLGIMAPYEIENSNEGKKSSIFCEKNSDNGNIMVELVEVDNKNQIGIILNLKSNLDYIYDYQDLIKDIFSSEGIKGQVNLYLEGRVSGALNYEERNYIADSMLKALDAKVVSENKDSDVFTIYAYTDKIDEYVKSIGRKINVNVSADYDENTNETVIYLASPTNNLDY